jgi:hypothetical protein
MHNHDLDLVASLAEGRLPAGAAATAEKDINECSRCSSELVAHRTALEALAEAPRPTLTEAEAVVLRSSVAEAIGLNLSPPVPGPPKRKVPWGAIALAGASLAAIVAVVPVMGLLSTSADDDAGEVVAATFAEQDTELRSETSAAAPGGGLDAAPEVAEPAEAEALVVTTTVPATTLAGEDAAAGTDLMALWNSPDEMRAVLDDQTTVQRDAHACTDAAVEILGPDLSVVNVPVLIDGNPVSAYVVDTDGIDRLVAFDPENCTLLRTLP